MIFALAEKELDELVVYLCQNLWLKYEDWLVVKSIYDALIEDQDSKKHYQKAISSLSSKFEVLQSKDCIRSEFERNLQIQIFARDGGDIKVVREVVQKCDKPNSPDHNGMTPLQVAASKGRHDIVQLLAPFEKNPNAPDINGYTPIQQATRNGHVEVVKILAPLSENPNSPDPEGWTPIQFACNKDNINLEIIKALAPISKHPNAPDMRGWTPIQRAAKNGQAEIVRILAPLTKKGNTKDPEGLTPIERAVGQWNVEIIKILDPSHPIPKLPKMEDLEKFLPEDPRNDPGWDHLSREEKGEILVAETKGLIEALGPNWMRKWHNLGFGGFPRRKTLKLKEYSLRRSAKITKLEETEDKMDFETDLEFQVLVDDLKSKLINAQSKLKELSENVIQITSKVQEEKAEDKMDVDKDVDQELDEDNMMLDKNQKYE